MPYPYKCILVGTGGMGGSWCRSALPSNMTDGLVEPVAAVDIVPEHLDNAIDGLGLSRDRCYTDARKAFAENEADFAIVVVPPAAHESIVDVALEHDCHILSEKPIADSMEASVRIARKVAAAERKMGVTMSHRFRQDITTLRTIVHEQTYGRLDYLVCRFTCANRNRGEWGRFRYDIPDALLVEGSVHHLDLLCDIACGGDGSLCDTIYGRTWNTPWSDFNGDAQALVTMTMQNGRQVMYEGAKTNAVGINCWSQEYIRAECEHATLIMNHGGIEALPYGRGNAQRGEGEPVALIDQPKWSNTWLCEKFLHWLDGGPAMETNVQDNLQSVALIFAAAESSRTGQPVDVQAFIDRFRTQS
ncbi:MAG: hypothetical protein CMJ18_22120 [Phycisphaeraceae bacterium]|nr:hypothetical protein [Phycisphaeraceae bacterium]